MAEYVQVLERLRSLAIEWTEQYEEIVARSQHIEYLYSNLDKLPSANSLLVYQQHKQIQAQLCKIRQLTRSLAAIQESPENMPKERSIGSIKSAGRQLGYR
ncbi:hypothetical protein LPJ78_004863 [Coemansia sp. RSA 989]|nr:hypothetical protein LPJ78_004863 [Coemansia sp. RSA 989]